VESSVVQFVEIRECRIFITGFSTDGCPELFVHLNQF